MKRAHSPPPEEKQNSRKKKEAGARSNVFNHAIMSSQIALFPAIASFLHWKDSVALGAVNKDCRNSYVMNRDEILQPLLRFLERLCKSNVHWCCENVYAPASKRVCTCSSATIRHADELPENQALAELDPRYEELYDSMPIHIKCSRMVHFLTTIVANMRPHLNFAQDSMNPQNTPEAIGTIQGNWSLGRGVRENGILWLYPQRAALAFNIALANFTQCAMEEGNEFCFNEAFLGNGGIDPSGSNFGITICSMVEGMMPLSNDDFVNVLRNEIIPSASTRALLGPFLTSRVILCSPFLEWINDNGNIVLPEGLESFDAGEAAQRVMDEWNMMVADLDPSNIDYLSL